MFGPIGPKRLKKRTKVLKRMIQLSCFCVLGLEQNSYFVAGPVESGASNRNAGQVGNFGVPAPGRSMNVAAASSQDRFLSEAGR